MGQIVSRHGFLYVEQLGWGGTFETSAARIVADFLNNFGCGPECVFVVVLLKRVSFWAPSPF
ncbi:hypothetical protein F5B17DRAFT_394997 [Nemania serpens]|nr:hypothetical protein F5B17DRAFT_394997 [Nemania serpens]